MLRFSAELIEEIRSLRFKLDENGQRVGKDLFINQAMMRVWIDDNSVKGLDRSLPRLGSYLVPQKLVQIPDYQWAIERYQNDQLKQQGSTETFTLDYNGYLNRSNGYYELDITSYIQQLAKMKADDENYLFMPPVFYLGPDAYSVIGAGQSVLSGAESDNPVSIRITYTIIEG